MTALTPAHGAPTGGRAGQTGTVAQASGAISGVVTDADTGVPLPGVVVHLGVQGQGSGGRFSGQLTDARGRFVFDQLGASTAYMLSASRAGYFDARYGQLPGVPPGSRIALADGQWFDKADIAMSKVGAIGGTIVDEAGEPAVGAFVRAFLQLAVGGEPHLAPVLTARTDDRGAYRLAGLVAGRYLIAVPSVQHTVPASATPAQIEGLRPDMMARLQALIDQGAPARRLNNGAIAEGDARLIVGNYVTPPPPAAGRARAYPMTFHPGTTDVASAVPVDLTAGGDRAGVDITLRPLPAVRVSGRVEGGSTPALLLRLLATGMEDLGRGGEAATALTDADGSFTFLNVPSGTYTLDARQSVFEFTARPPGAATASLPATPGRPLLGRQLQSPVVVGPVNTIHSAHLAPAAGPGMRSHYGRLAITVGTDDVSGVVLALQPTSLVRGRIVYEDVRNGPPPRAPMVFAAAASANRHLGLAASDNEGDLGASAFEIHAIVPGSYRLLVGTRPTTVVKSIQINGLDYSVKPIEIEPGQDIDGVTITLTDRVAAVSGIVRDKQGGAVDDAAVILFSTDRSVWPDLALATPWAKSTAPADGAFQFPALSAGEYFVAAIDRARMSHWVDPAFLGRIAPAATRISLAWGEARTVELRVVTVK